MITAILLDRKVIFPTPCSLWFYPEHWAYTPGRFTEKLFIMLSLVLKSLITIPNRPAFELLDLNCYGHLTNQYNIHTH